MDTLLIFIYEITDSSEIISNKDIETYINYNDLVGFFLLGLFASLCTFTFCCNSNKNTPKYVVVKQESPDNKINSV